jgi:hypothetical protein
VLSIIFSVLGAFVTQLSWFRTTSAPFSILFVQVATHWLGHWMAKILPSWKIGFGKFSFSLVSSQFVILYFTYQPVSLSLTHQPKIEPRSVFSKGARPYHTMVISQPLISMPLMIHIQHRLCLLV